jgi:hypothetical protein
MKLKNINGAKRTVKRSRKLKIKNESFDDATTDIIKTGAKTIIGVGLLGALGGMFNK